MLSLKSTLEPFSLLISLTPWISYKTRMDSGLVRELPPASRLDAAGPRAEDSLRLTMSLGEMSPQAACRFCGVSVIRPFDPLTLIQATEAVVVPTEQDEMETNYGDTDPRFFTDDDNSSYLSSMITQPLMVCSPQCWMAQSLVSLGEESVLGRILLTRYPYLRPTGAVGARYEQHRQELAAQMFDYRAQIREHFQADAFVAEGDG